MRAIDADHLKRWILSRVFKTQLSVADVIDQIDREDTIEPERKTGRWIPCSERMPEEPYGCLVTVWDTNPITMDEFENILPYFVGWDGEQWNDYDGEQCPFEVIAWMPLPEPYEEGAQE